MAAIVVKDCEKEKICKPSICVKNSGKKRLSCCALERAFCRTVKVRATKTGDVMAARSSARLLVESATCLTMEKI